jgi:hypothetical protein
VRAWQDLDKKLIAAMGTPSRYRNDAEIAAVRTALDEADKRIASLTARLEAEFPQFAESTSPKPVAIPEAQRLLGRDGALVVFSWPAYPM